MLNHQLINRKSSMWKKTPTNNIINLMKLFSLHLFKCDDLLRFIQAIKKKSCSIYMWLMSFYICVIINNVCAVTEGSSEFSDSDLDMSRRRSRRSQKKRVNYCETSESEGSQAETNRAKMKPRRQQDSSDSEGRSHTQLEKCSRSQCDWWWSVSAIDVGGAESQFNHLSLTLKQI